MAYGANSGAQMSQHQESQEIKERTSGLTEMAKLVEPVSRLAKEAYNNISINGKSLREIINGICKEPKNINDPEYQKTLTEIGFKINDLRDYLLAKVKDPNFIQAHPQYAGKSHEEITQTLSNVAKNISNGIFKTANEAFKYAQNQAAPQQQPAPAVPAPQTVAQNPQQPPVQQPPTQTA